MVHPSDDQRIAVSPANNFSDPSKGDEVATAEVYLIDISYQKPRKVELKKRVTRIGYTAVCDLKLRAPPVPDAEKKVVRYGEVQFIQVDGPPMEGIATTAYKAMSTSLQPAAIHPKNKPLLKDRSKSAQIDHHHRILIAMHPRIRYNLYINRVRVFDSDTDAKKNKFSVSEPLGVYSAFSSAPAADGAKNLEEEKRKKMDEPWPMWSSGPLKNGDDILAWWSCAGDQSSAVCRFQYKLCGPEGCDADPKQSNSQSEMGHPFFSLPRELQIHILSKLNPHDLIATVAPASHAFFSLVRDPILWRSVEVITAAWTTPTAWAVLEVLHQVCSASLWKKKCGITVKHLTVLHCPLTCDEVFTCVAHSCADLESLFVSFKGRQSAKLAGYKLRLFGAKCPKLSRLIFEKIGFVTFEDCGPLPQVKTLGLRSCRNSRKRIDFDKFAKNFPNWQHAALGPGISFDFGQHPGLIQSVRVMDSLSKLTRFWFSWSSFVGVTARFSFANLPLLTLLVVENAEDLGDHHLAQIAALQELETLGISYGAFAVSEKPTKSGWLTLIREMASAEPQNASLRHLRFKNVKSGLDDEVLRAIGSKLASTLVSLDLSGCQSISDRGLTSVAMNCSQLQSLELGENDSLMGTGWLEELTERPKFAYLNFTPSSGSKNDITHQRVVIPERLRSKVAENASAICSDPLFS